MSDVLIRLGVDDTGVPPPVARTREAILSVGQAGEISARQTTAAMRQLPAQFTDIATQLAGGQNPLLILLQQGGQIKDSFGGVRNAIAGVAASLSPARLGIGAVAAAVVAFVTAAIQGNRQSEQLRDTLALTGNAAGLTAARLEGLAATVSSASGQTVGASRQILVGLAQTGQVSAGAMGAVATAIARVADVSGEDAKKITADFATMSGGVAKWAAEHNKAWNFITVEQYKYIRRLEEQGQGERAAQYVSEQVVRALADQKKNLGLLESAWESVGKIASGAWNAMLNVGREQSTRQQLDIATERLRALGDNLTPRAREAAEQRIQYLKEQLKLENQQADARSRNAAENRKAIEDERKGEGKAPEFPFQAIRNAQQQYRQDFLRSEKAFYEEDAKLTRKDAEDKERARREAQEADAKDAERAARQADQRLTATQSYLQAQRDANERAAIELLQDERARGEALIALDREIEQRRIDALGLDGEALDEANAQADRRVALRRAALAREEGEAQRRLSEQTGRQLYSDTYNAIAAAFNDSSGNPVRAFGDAVARTLYVRASEAIVNALTTAAVGANGQGGALSTFLSFLSGFKYSGSSNNPSAPNYENSFDTMNTPSYAVGTAYVPRTGLALLHEGEAVVPKRYNPAAGGMAAQSSINVPVSLYIDSRTDAGTIAQVASSATRQGVRQAFEELRAAGVIR